MNADVALFAGFLLGVSLTLLGHWYWRVDQGFRGVRLPRRAEGRAPAQKSEDPAVVAQHATINARFGESLILEAVCEADTLDAVFVAYLTADSAHRRQSPINERMFYDACLGGALRRIVDTYRATRVNPHHDSQQRSTSCH